jgi:hypothetical protein
VSAVKKILRGFQREETARFVAFRSHWRFAAEFCTPAEPHEKGGVEGEVGYFRRNHWVPVPAVDTLDTLNRQLLISCREDEDRHIAGHGQSVGAGILIERSHLLPMAAACDDGNFPLKSVQIVAPSAHELLARSFRDFLS